MAIATTGQPAVLANGLFVLKFSRQFLDKLLEGIPANKMTTPPLRGGNHALWIMGHVAYCDDMFMAELGGTAPKFPPKWVPLFKDGSEPTDDSGTYPSLAEVRKVYNDLRRDLLSWFDGKSDKDLAKPLPKEWSSFAPNLGALMSTIAGHEMNHAGQLTVVRKTLGLPRQFA